MGKKNKLERFAEISAFSNVFEHTEAPKGNWQSAFEKQQPIVVELACGKGEYTVGLARMNPDKNFIGVDIKGNRIWCGAKIALDDQLSNVAFLRCQIGRITDYFEAEEVDEFWITFPDPQPRDGKRKKRLTHPLFLERYKAISGPGTIVNVKTDSLLFYEFTLETIQEMGLELLTNNDDIYTWEDRPEELNIKTFYERKWLEEGITSKYIKFRVA